MNKALNYRFLSDKLIENILVYLSYKIYKITKINNK